MAATVPKDLKRETWKKIKPTLMKQTKLGETLEAYGKSREEVFKKPSLKQFDELTTELQGVSAAVGKATEVAKAGKFKDCQESLKGYAPLIATEAKAVMVKQSEYKKIVDDWIKVREDCLENMEKHKTEYEKLAKKCRSTMTTLEQMVQAGKPLPGAVIMQAVALANKSVKALKTLQIDYIKTCNTVRIAPTTPPSMPLHLDEKDPKYLPLLNKVQSYLEGNTGSQIGELEKAIEDIKKIPVAAPQKVK